MGYVEDLAAREAARQNVEAAKKAEMGRMMNQGEVGLAGNVAKMPYVPGMSQEDAYKLAMAQKAEEASYLRNQELMRNAPVRNGVIDPSYWEAAQKASNYEMRGLAGQAR